MAKPLFFIEDVDTAPRTTIAHTGETAVSVTPLAPLGRLASVAGGFVLALFLHRDARGWKRLKLSLIHALGIELANLGHSVGHIVSARAVGAPMDELLITATRHATLYDENDVTSEQHIGRSLGGPLANVAMALLFGLFAWRSPVARTLAMVNAGTAALAFLPLPDVDGEVLWRELLGRREQGQQAEG